jgi:hypothetical protein
MLKMIFKIKGRTTMAAISFFHAIQNTLPKERAIKIYRNVHTGPKSHAGGAHDGFISCEYQS